VADIISVNVGRFSRSLTHPSASLTRTRYFPDRSSARQLTFDADSCRSTPPGRAASAGPRRPRTGSGRAAPSISRSVEPLSRAASATSTRRSRGRSARTSVARRRAVSPQTRTSRTRPRPAADVVAVAIETQETGSSRSSRPCPKLNTAAASVYETTATRNAV